MKVWFIQSWKLRIPSKHPSSYFDVTSYWTSRELSDKGYGEVMHICHCA